MPNTYTQVREAAIQRDSTDTTRTWALADAVLAHIPALPEGNPNYPPEGGVASVPERLIELSNQLALDGVTTPKGDTYTDTSLKHLREVAMAWPAEARHPEAAYRTHREAMNSTNGRGILDVLVRYARGEQVRRPNSIEADAWTEVKMRIDMRERGFKVVANDLRIAQSQRPNVPGRTNNDVQAAVAELVEQHGSDAIAAVIGRDDEMSTRVRTEAIRNQTGRNPDRDRPQPRPGNDHGTDEPRIVRTLRGAMVAVEIAMLADSMPDIALYLAEQGRLDEEIVMEDTGEIYTERVKINDECVLVIDKMMRTLRAIGQTDNEILTMCQRLVDALPSAFTVNDEALAAFLDGSS
jgi:hypothetical protein